MTAYQTIAILLGGTALASYVNHRFLRLPSTIGLMAFALLVSVTGVGLNRVGLVDLTEASAFVRGIDFGAILLKGLLSLFLFAGALHIDLHELRRVRRAVGILATLGVVLSAAATGTLVWLAGQALGFHLPLIHALLFGALIAPTDPVAVLAILKTAGAPKRFVAKIGGESLFNDGVAVVLFVALLGVAASAAPPDPLALLGQLVVHVLGGAALGAGGGWLVHRLTRRVDDYKVEVLLTLALATGVYALADSLALSAPIAVVAAGLAIGYHRTRSGMSAPTRRHLDMFWELLDEILNGVLFLLIGLELMVMPMSREIALIGAAAILAVLAGRFASVALPVGLMRLFHTVDRGTIRLLTWGGLRGGISIALALSLPAGEPKDLLLAMTYIVVVFSVLAQGLTFRRAVQALMPCRKTEEGK